MKCVAPSEIIISTSPILRLFGLFAEAKISRRYLSDNGRDNKGFFPPALEDFTDKNLKGLIGNIKLFTDFIRSNNPHVDVIFFERELRTKGVGAVPDITTHLRFGPGLYELYEIKPNSSSGRGAGRDKLVKLDNICTKFGLPYIRGQKYKPDVKIRIFRGIVPPGIFATAYLHFMAAEDGLIVYEVCVEADFGNLPLRIIILAIAAIIIFVLSRGSLPIPTPILPPKIPVPVIPPIPVPAADFGALGLSSSAPLPVIQNSVGRGGANASNDVRAIQLLLNDWRGKAGQNLLAVDGIAGPKTIAALNEFQTATGGEGGVAEPNGGTVQMLVANHLNSLAAGIDRSFMDDMHQYRVMVLEASPSANDILASYLAQLGQPQ